MLLQRVLKDTPERRQAHRARERQLKVLVARLVERFEEVSWGEMGPELGRLMDDVALMIDSFSARMSEEQQQLFDGNGLMRRISNSIT